MATVAAVQMVSTPVVDDNLATARRLVGEGPIAVASSALPHSPISTNPSIFEVCDAINFLANGSSSTMRYLYFIHYLNKVNDRDEKGKKEASWIQTNLEERLGILKNT